MLFGIIIVGSLPFVTVFLFKTNEILVSKGGFHVDRTAYVFGNFNGDVGNAGFDVQDAVVSQLVAYFDVNVAYAGIDFNIAGFVWAEVEVKRRGSGFDVEVSPKPKH